VPKGTRNVAQNRDLGNLKRQVPAQPVLLGKLRNFSSAREHGPVRQPCTVKAVRPVDVAHAEARCGGARVSEIVIHRDRARITVEQEHEQPAVRASGIQDDSASHIIPGEPVSKLVRTKG